MSIFDSVLFLCYLYRAREALQDRSNHREKSKVQISESLQSSVVAAHWRAHTFYPGKKLEPWTVNLQTDLVRYPRLPEND